MGKQKIKKVAMIVFSNYPEDPRVRREAEALAEKGYEIDIFCLKRLNQKKVEKYGNITVYRASLSRSRGSKLSYMMEYLSFIIYMSFTVFFKFIARQYQVVQVHNMPDILVLSAFWPKVFGAKVILDLHDPMPEVFMTKYEMPKDHKVIKILIFLEKLSIKLANQVLTPNLAFKKLFISRGCPENKIDIVMNSPNESIFIKPDAYTKKNKDAFSIIYHGSIVERHGLYDALIAVKELRKKIPNIVFNIYGEGDYMRKLPQDIKDLKLDDCVFFHGFVQQDDLVELILEADLGIIPNRRSPFTEINLPTRILEYLCLEKPVIVPSTIGIRDYFDQDSLLFFKAEDPQDLAKEIYKVYEDPAKSMEKINKGIEIYENYTWQKQKEHFVNLMDNVIYKRRRK